MIAALWKGTQTLFADNKEEDLPDADKIVNNFIC